MNDLQLAAALAAPTGTGLLYGAFEQGNDIAVWKNGVGTSRSTIALKRVQAKPTLVHAGVERGEFKRTMYTTVADVEYPCIYTITTSIPVVADATVRTAIFLNGALMARDVILSNFVSNGGVLPT